MGETRAARVSKVRRPGRADVDRSVLAGRARRCAAEKLICTDPSEGLEFGIVFILPRCFRYFTSLDASFENVLSLPWLSTDVTLK